MMCSAHYAVASVVGIPHLQMASTGSPRLLRVAASACWKTSRACFLSQRRVESLRTSCASTPCCLRLRRRLAFGLPVVPAMCSPVPSRRFMLCLRCAEAQPTVALALKGFRQAPSLVSHNLLAVWCERHHLMRRHGFPDVMRWCMPLSELRCSSKTSGVSSIVCLSTHTCYQACLDMAHDSQFTVAIWVLLLAKRLPQGLSSLQWCRSSQCLACCLQSLA